MKKIFISYWPAILWSAIIFILLALPGQDLPEERAFRIPNFDKLVHFGIFAVFVWVWSWCVARYKKQRLSNTTAVASYKLSLVSYFILIALIGILFGYGLELVQKYLVPQRDYDLWDVLADSLGCVAGLLFSLIAYNKTGRR